MLALDVPLVPLPRGQWRSATMAITHWHFRWMFYSRPRRRLGARSVVSDEASCHKYHRPAMRCEAALFKARVSICILQRAVRSLCTHQPKLPNLTAFRYASILRRNGRLSCAK